MNKLIFSILGITLCTLLNAQVMVDQNYTIEEYVNDVLLGTGIDATNITFTGSETQIGFMSNANSTSFPVNSGIILSTEHAVNVEVGLDYMIPVGEAIDGEPDLFDVANSVPPLIGQGFSIAAVHNVCILEFDLVASENTLVFNYSFGSDEYLAWVNSSFNDVFAFFLSGPGIVGPFASPAGFPDGAINIAGVPDTDPFLPITVSSVNNNLNEEYYIDNPNNDGFAIDGCTNTFSVTYALSVGETYHMKFAIADGTDTALESIVVIETGSFSALPLDVVESDIIEPTISVYPNPVNGTMNVSMTSSSSSETEIQILDLTGRIVLEEAFTSSIGKKTLSIDCSHLRAGSYIVQISEGSSKIQKQIVIE